MLSKKLQMVERDLGSFFLERQRVIRGICVALLTQQHVFLLGPPGTAKSALLEAVQESFGFPKSSTFRYLMTAFTVPEEIFGPVDLAGLDKSEFRRITRGRAPSSRLLFLDEIWKANSSILNSLLTLLNERMFDNDGKLEKCPLELCMGASNELPQSDELRALWDRFLLRFVVEPLRSSSSQRRVFFETGIFKPSVKLTAKTLKEAREAVTQVEFSTDMQAFFVDLKSAVEAEKFNSASDRRWKAAVKAVKAMAFLNGRGSVAKEDCQILASILWDKPQDIPGLSKVILKMTNPLALKAREYTDMCREVCDDCKTKDKKDRASHIMAMTLARGKLEETLEEIKNILEKLPENEGFELRLAKETITEWNVELAEGLNPRRFSQKSK